MRSRVVLSIDHESVWDHVNEWTQSIEIKYRCKENDSGILTRVYFPLNSAVCLKLKFYLSKFQPI